MVIDNLTGVGDVLLGAGILLNSLVSIYTAFVSKGTNSSMAELTQNTNSIKDALVKVTGESERAKGVLEGREQQKAAPE